MILFVGKSYLNFPLNSPPLTYCPNEPVTDVGAYPLVWQVINFGVNPNNQPISPMPATDTIGPIPEVMPGDNNGSTPPTFM